MPGEKTARDASAACRPRDESGSNRPRKEAEARPAATLTAGSAFSARLLTLSLLLLSRGVFEPPRGVYLSSFHPCYCDNTLLAVLL